MPTTNPKTKIANHNPALMGLLDEDTINLDEHPVPKPTAEGQIDACDTKLILNNFPVIGRTQKYMIKRTAFITLFNKAMTLRTEGNFVTGVKIDHGFDNNPTVKKQVLIYTPVRLFNGAPVGSSDTFEYKDMEQDLPYVYNTATDDFTPITPGQKAAFVADYKALFQMQHTATPGPGPFIPGVDVESIVFSFQEIFAIMYDNRGAGNSNQNIFSGLDAEPIILFNCIKADGGTGLNKHSLLLAPKDVTFIGFYKVYGNLGHLCPPHCSLLRYRID